MAVTSDGRPPRPHTGLTAEGRRLAILTSYTRRGSRFTPRQRGAWDRHSADWVIPDEAVDDPEFSFRYVLAPAGIGFLQSSNLGRRYRGDLFVGFATPDPLGGPIFRFNLSQDRKSLSFVDARLRDKVMDNATFHSTEESESLVFGTNFGIVTDIRTGPNGNLYVVSLANGTIYEVYHR